MDHLLAGIWNYGIVFLLILTVVVFVHELGHYLVARHNGVRVEVFSIGFGPELFGWNDKAGTRWRIGLAPLGGYVRMLGDADAASATGTELAEADKPFSFRHKRVGQRAAVVAAGPLANFAFAIVGMAVMFMVFGQSVAEPVVGEVMADSAAAQAGLRPGDRIIAINGSETQRFQDIQRIVRLDIDRPLELAVLRGGDELSLTAQPKIVERRSLFGDLERVPVLGISADSSRVRVIHHGPVSAMLASLSETETMVRSTFIGIGQMISGSRSSDELGGPIRIAKGAGEAAQMGLPSLVFYTILLSLNLGLINLFPIPVLDGGHLLFYGIEALLGRPLGERAQEYGFRVGLFLVLALMVFATRNDIVSLPLWGVVKKLFWS